MLVLRPAAHGLVLPTVRVTFSPLLAQSGIFLSGTCSACLPGDSSACHVDSPYEQLEQQVHLVANSSQSHGGGGGAKICLSSTCSSLYFPCDCSGKANAFP